MNLQERLAKIRSRAYTRSELSQMRKNAEATLKKGHPDAAAVLAAIDEAEPLDDFIVFMGFCPGASMENRLDVEWKEKGICTFIFLDSPSQLERFNTILPGDLIVLKKRHVFGKTMQLFGHGRVSGVRYDDQGHRYLQMNWSPQEQVIEVPLMACNSTVDIRTIEQVEAEMPAAFYDWLKSPEAALGA